MLVALLSDTHDNTPMTQAALDKLAPHHPDLYLHAGDMVSPDMLPLFAGLNFHFVFGNNEYDLAGLRSMAASLDLHCHNHFAALTLDGKRLALLHGHDSALMNKTLRPKNRSEKPFDYLVHGHTHERRDERLPDTRGCRIINPGAIHRARQKSVALLDTQNDSLTFLNL